nr:CHAP domain-containing protein [Commensalibacter communis]
MKNVYVHNYAKTKLTSFLLMFSCMVFSTSYAHARSTHHNTKKVTHHKNAGVHVQKASATSKSNHHSKKNSHFKTRKVSYRHKGYRHGGGHVIQCVTFARSASDVQLSGNAGNWWANAAGIYERGNTPEPNSVLSFRSTRKMPYGHVAVVTQVVDSRTVIIDQSHWAQRGISRNTPVIDVSPNNDWTAVRVATNGDKSTFGSIYPTHGFIYPNGGRNVETQNVSTQRKAPKRNIKTWSADAATTKGYSKTNTQVALSPNVSDDFFADAPDRSIR